MKLNSCAKTYTSKSLAKKSSGFTLIECLVALFIIAIVLASSARSIGLSINDVRDSYIRQVAGWVADNQSNQYHLDGVYPDLGITKSNVNSAGIDFVVEANVVALPNPYFRRIEIAVAEKNTPNRPIYKLTSFIAQY